MMYKYRRAANYRLAIYLTQTKRRNMVTVNEKNIISIKAVVPEKKMKVVHFANVKPNLAGISGTAIDMVSAERLVGIDAQLVDYSGGGKPCIVGIEKNGVTTVGPSQANDADIIVRHSAIPASVQAMKKPQVMCLHGRPEYGFMLQYNKGMKLLDEYIQCDADPNYKGFVTFWAEHFNYLNIILPDSQIFYVPAMVNLDACKPEGTRLDYDVEGGHPNILIADMWREDTTPFNTIMAAAVFVKKYCPEARIHIYGLQKHNENPLKHIIDQMKITNIVSHSETIVKNMAQIYRANDILVTSHHIATRVIREALAFGLPVVAGEGCAFTDYTADARYTEGFASKINDCWMDFNDDKERLCRDARDAAEENFNLKQAGDAALAVYQRVLEEAKDEPIIISKPKETGPMIYNFIAYSPEEKEKLGETYNKYMGLLKEDDWACFIDHDAMFTTDDWYKLVQDIIATNQGYGLFSAVTNRIGNPDQKFDKLEPTHDIIYHRKIGAMAMKQFGTNVMDVTDKHCISGVVMLVSKAAWKKAGGFMNGFLGVDNDFHKRIAKAGYKVGVAKGLYVYHWYRQDNSELKPIAM